MYMDQVVYMDSFCVSYLLCYNVGVQIDLKREPMNTKNHHNSHDHGGHMWQRQVREREERGLIFVYFLWVAHSVMGILSYGPTMFQVENSIHYGLFYCYTVVALLLALMYTYALQMYIGSNQYMDCCTQYIRVSLTLLSDFRVWDDGHRGSVRSLSTTKQGNMHGSSTRVTSHGLESGQLKCKLELIDRLIR